MKPPERAPASKGAKQGSVLPDAMRGTRRPSSSCAQSLLNVMKSCHVMLK